ncbi:hypothetical protein C8J57DRAFT_1517544 [Mycena rebaudengoi]|nr:hypothetical protein C8J57DRAFT_1517544 [Mycena rebaudengoi]
MVPLCPVSLKKKSLPIHIQHDTCYWCLPPLREENGKSKGSFAFYLVTQGCAVGVWRSWTVVNAMVAGYPGASQRSHHSYAVSRLGCQIKKRASGDSGKGNEKESGVQEDGRARISGGPKEILYAPVTGRRRGPVIVDVGGDCPSGEPVFCYMKLCSAVAPPEGSNAPPPPPLTTPLPVTVLPPLPAEPAAEYRLAVITQPEEKQKRRHKAGEPKGKWGKPSRIWGTKFTFFSKRKDAWLAAEATHQVGPFYTKMVKLYVKMYGYFIGDNEDLEEDIEDPPDSAADIVVNERLSEEEAVFWAEFHQNLRRLGGWYRAQFGSLVEKEKTEFAELFTGILDGAPPKPQRPQLIQFYSRKFYDTRVKEHFEAQMAGVVRHAGHMGQSAPAELAVRNQVMKEVWEEETEMFQGEVKQALEREYAVSLKGWQASLADSPAKTAKELDAYVFAVREALQSIDRIHRLLQNAAFYLQPFVDAIQARFGMCVSVLLCGKLWWSYWHTECTHGENTGIGARQLA